MTEFERAVYLAMSEIVERWPRDCGLNWDERIRYYRTIIGRLQERLPETRGTMNRIRYTAEYWSDITALTEARTASDNVLRLNEECGELIQAASKVIRTAGDDLGTYEGAVEHMSEEIADVMICVDVIRCAFGINDLDVDRMVRAKMARNMDRLREE